MFNRLLRRI